MSDEFLASEVEYIEERLASLDSETFLTVVARLIHALAGVGVNIDELLDGVENSPFQSDSSEPATSPNGDNPSGSTH